MYIPKANRDSEGVDTVSLKNLHVCFGEICVLQRFRSQYFLEAKIRVLRQLERLPRACQSRIVLGNR